MAMVLELARAWIFIEEGGNGSWKAETSGCTGWVLLLAEWRRAGAVGPEADKAVSGMTALPSGGLDSGAPPATATR